MKSFKRILAMGFTSLIISSPISILAVESNTSNQSDMLHVLSITESLKLSNNITSERGIERFNGIFTITANDGAVVRVGPRPDYEIVSWFKKGTELYLLSETPTYVGGIAWYNVKNINGSVRGWVEASKGIAS